MHFFIVNNQDQRGNTQGVENAVPEQWPPTQRNHLKEQIALMKQTICTSQCLNALSQHTRLKQMEIQTDSVSIDNVIVVWTTQADLTQYIRMTSN